MEKDSNDPKLVSVSSSSSSSSSLLTVLTVTQRHRCSPRWLWHRGRGPDLGFNDSCQQQDWHGHNCDNCDEVLFWIPFTFLLTCSSGHLTKMIKTVNLQIHTRHKRREALVNIGNNCHKIFQWQCIHLFQARAATRWDVSEKDHVTECTIKYPLLRSATHLQHHVEGFNCTHVSLSKVCNMEFYWVVERQKLWSRERAETQMRLDEGRGRGGKGIKSSPWEAIGQNGWLLHGGNHKRKGAMWCNSDWAIQMWKVVTLVCMLQQWIPEKNGEKWQSSKWASTNVKRQMTMSLTKNEERPREMWGTRPQWALAGETSCKRWENLANGWMLWMWHTLHCQCLCWELEFEWQMKMCMGERLLVQRHWEGKTMKRCTLCKGGWVRNQEKMHCHWIWKENVPVDPKRLKSDSLWWVETNCNNTIVQKIRFNCVQEVTWDLIKTHWNTNDSWKRQFGEIWSFNWCTG